MKNVIRKTALFAAGVYALSKEKVQDFVEMLKKEGHVSEEEGRDLVEDLWKRVKETEEKMQNVAEKKVRAALDRASFATKKEVEDLRKRVEKLEG